GVDGRGVCGVVPREAGDSATSTIGLEAAPSANVVIALSSSNPGEGVPSPTSLTFTPSDWSQPRRVVVHGVDDFVVDGDQAYQIITAPATSADPHYSGRDAKNVDVVNHDNDHAGIVVTPTAGLVTTEAGGAATFTVRLESQPEADVVIGVASNGPAEGTAAPASLTFHAADWNQPQTVTVTGVDDSVVDGDKAYVVVLSPATSGDAHYQGMDPADVSVTNHDNDVVGVLFAPAGALSTTESGGTATFTAQLTSKPSGDVSFGLSSSNAGEGAV